MCCISSRSACTIIIKQKLLYNQVVQWNPFRSIVAIIYYRGGLYYKGLFCTQIVHTDLEVQAFIQGWPLRGVSCTIIIFFNLFTIFFNVVLQTTLFSLLTFAVLKFLA